MRGRDGPRPPPTRTSGAELTFLECFRAPSRPLVLQLLYAVAVHRTQVNLEEEQYRWLKQQAGSGGSIAAVVRRLIDAARSRPVDPGRDPAIRYLLEQPASSRSGTTSVTTLDEDLYGS